MEFSRNPAYNMIVNYLNLRGEDKEMHNNHKSKFLCSTFHSPLEI